MGITDDISPKAIDKVVENFKHEICNLRVGILQMLSLDKLYKKEADHEKSGDQSINGTKIIIRDEVGPFQKKKMVFFKLYGKLFELKDDQHFHLLYS